MIYGLYGKVLFIVIVAIAAGALIYNHKAIWRILKWYSLDDNDREILYDIEKKRIYYSPRINERLNEVYSEIRKKP